MAESTPGKSVQQRLREQEKRRARLLQCVYISIGGGIALALIMICFGFWMHTEEGGIYADCSNPANRSSPYCQPKTSQSDRDWSDLSSSRGGGYAPFTLHGE